MAVQWETISHEQYDQAGSFVIHGIVEGATVQPQATIKVIGAFGSRACFFSYSPLKDSPYCPMKFLSILQMKVSKISRNMEHRRVGIYC